MGIILAEQKWSRRQRKEGSCKLKDCLVSRLEKWSLDELSCQFHGGGDIDLDFEG